MDPKKILIKDFSYSLPEERIAKYPLAERDASRLLIYKEGKIRTDTNRNLSDHIPANSFLIFNDTRVVEARLLFQKTTGGVIEIFCIEPDDQYPDISTALSQHEKVLWCCLIGGASKWKHGQLLEKKIKHGEKEIILKAKYIAKKTDCFIIELSWNDSSLNFAEILHYAGAIPLPFYIKRNPEEADADRYQTIYARYEGSVAAPTAGLHFTGWVFEKLKERKIENDFVTLHIGAGTFKPVKSVSIEDHEMHAEFIHVSKQTIEKILFHLHSNIIAVGTTSLRTIESLYWLGVKIISENISENIFQLSQWAPYDLPSTISPEEALHALINQLKKNDLDYLTAKTKIIIAPGYKSRIAKALITNFHQPQSTLLLLVAALIGDEWKKVYEFALQNNFRFLSYGDGCLLWINK